MGSQGDCQLLSVIDPYLPRALEHRSESRPLAHRLHVAPRHEHRPSSLRVARTTPQCKLPSGMLLMPCLDLLERRRVGNGTMKSANVLWFALILLSIVGCDDSEDRDYSDKVDQKYSAIINNTYKNYILSGRYEKIIAKCRAPSSDLVRIHISGFAEGGDGENPVIFTEISSPNIKISEILRGPLFMDDIAISSANKIELKLFRLHYPYLLNDPPAKLQFDGWRMTLSDLCRRQYMFTDAIIIDQFSKKDGARRRGQI